MGSLFSQCCKYKLQPEEIEENYSYYGEAFHHKKKQPGLYEGEEGLKPEKLEYILGDEIIRALNDLSDDFREVIYLCDVQALSYQEIATVLDIPVGTVRSRIARARAILQKHLWQYAVDKGLWRRTEKKSGMKAFLKKMFKSSGGRSLWGGLFL